MSQQSNNRPVHVLRRRGVKISVFRNETEGNAFYKVSLQKIYKDEHDEWKTTTSLGRDDLPVSQLLIGRAWEYILDQESEPHKE